MELTLWIFRRSLNETDSIGRREEREGGRERRYGGTSVNSWISACGRSLSGKEGSAHKQRENKREGS